MKTELDMKAKACFDALPSNLWNKKVEPWVRLFPDWYIQPEWVKDIFRESVRKNEKI